jgi:predicted ATPase
VPLLEVLATSRGCLRLSGEHEFPVAPLASPDPGHRLELDTLGAFPGVELFLERASAVRPDFRLSEANARAVGAICARVDGLPLAIELAAARVRLLSPEEIVARLARPFELLTGGPRDLPDRQRTLAETISWSLALLDPGARRMFTRLGVFAGGFTVDAAEAVGGDMAGVIDALAVLIDHGLVQRSAETGPAARPRLLETIREFALRELAASGEQDDVRAAHAAFYVALAGSGASERLEPEQANLRAAMRWYLAGEDQDGALALSAGLSAFWLSRGYLSEGRRWLEQALALGEGPATVDRARALIAAGLLAYHQADYAVAVSHLQGGVDQCRARGDEADVARALAALALARTSAGDLAPALRLAAEALAAHRQLDDEAGVGRSLEVLGRVLWIRGDYGQARARLQESRVVAGRLGARDVLARASQGLGYVALADGDLEGAEALLEESLAEFRELGDRWWALRGMCALGHVAARRGAHGAARLRFEQGLELARELGDRMLEAACLEGLAGAHGPALAARLLGTPKAFVSGRARRGRPSCWPTANAARTARGAPWANSASPPSGHEGGRWAPARSSALRLPVREGIQPGSPCARWRCCSSWQLALPTPR